MTPEVFKIVLELKKPPFVIENPDGFAEMLNSVYWRKDISQELRKMALWCASNPKKGKKKQWKRFICGWFSRIR